MSGLVDQAWNRGTASQFDWFGVEFHKQKQPCTEPPDLQLTSQMNIKVHQKGIMKKSAFEASNAERH
ncbi:hypothetical protein T11_18554 [Trichinella zimbabwensis]|uniref:Uncharacterized protein n=1 Tax=Trichinella zimbabwensis TaxID=268475 RepID=A0A0V1I3G1_9BILA|nr:hypothetical protein T11_18554 [Trichinella zimbabwensis]